MKTTHEILASLNDGLARPTTRQVFERSIRPLMAAEGDAAKHGGTWLFSSEYLWQWRIYLRGRETLIAQGRWSPKRPYSIEDRDAIMGDGIVID